MLLKKIRLENTINRKLEDRDPADLPLANEFIQNVVKDTVELRPLAKSSTLLGNSVQATTG